MYRNRLIKFIQLFSIIIAVLFISAVVNAQSLNDIIARQKTHPKIEGTLIRLHDRHKQAPAAALKFAQEKALKVNDQDKVTVFIMAELGKTADTIDKAALESYGVDIVKSVGGILKAKIPIDKITEIADNVRGISFIRLPDKPHSQYYNSEGVTLTNATFFQSAGYTGAGVKVAVIDQDFAGVSAAISAGALPSTIIAQDCTGAACTSIPSPYNNLGTSVHGTALAEIIYNMAPGAQLYLIKEDDASDLVTATNFCMANGIKIINFSAVFFNTNFYDGKCWPYLSSPVCTVNDAYDQGILWVNAAGNQSQSHYTATYTDLNNSGFHDEGIWINAQAGDVIEIYLTWDAWPYTDQDYDLWLYDSWGNLVDWGIGLQTGTQQPIEQIYYVVPYTGNYLALIQKYRATANLKLEFYSLNHDITPSVTSGSVLSPADAANAIAVGAMDYHNWTTGPIDSYSSQGPTNDGRIKPDIAGPSWVSTFSFGDSAFGGTSSASPHVAGAAALILSKYPYLTVANLRFLLVSYAIDMGDPGQDNTYGYGRLFLPCIGITPSAYAYGLNSATGTVTLTAIGNCPWTATSNDSWISITAGSTGQGSGTISYYVDVNATGIARKGTITIGGQTFTISQAAGIFYDDPNDFFTPYIDAIASEGITKGCWGNFNYFCPYDVVTRGAMAAFIIRSIYGEDFSYTQTPYFTDVPPSNGYFKYVQKMRDTGITKGCQGDPNYFCPDDVVTRGAMAAFIIRAKYGEAFSYTQMPYFTDVPASNDYFKYIQKMKDERITGNVGTYNWTDVVIREHMAAFLARAFLGMQ